jgi:hypothetical protein
VFHNLRKIKCYDGGVLRVAAAVVGAGVASAAIGASASKSAANTQAGAANNAANLQYQATQNAQANLAPYNQLGQSAINPLLNAMGYNNDFSVNSNSPLQQQFSFNASNLDQTPGYQFALQQGLKSVQNSAASRGLGLSGAQLKGATNYATGLADQTYNQQYQNALSTYNTNYNTASNNANRLAGIVQQGQNSAAQVGSMGMTGAANQGNLLTQAGNANAAGTVGSANALSSGLNTAASGYMANSYLNNLLGNNSNIYGNQTNGLGTNGPIGGTASNPAYG